MTGQLEGLTRTREGTREAAGSLDWRLNCHQEQLERSRAGSREEMSENSEFRDKAGFSDDRGRSEATKNRTSCSSWKTSV